MPIKASPSSTSTACKTRSPHITSMTYRTCAVGHPFIPRLILQPYTQCFDCFTTVTTPDRTMEKQQLQYTFPFSSVPLPVPALKSKHGKPIAPKLVRFKDQDKPAVKTIPASIKPNKLTAQEELMAIHLHCGHTPFGILINAAKQGLLPTLIIADKYPKCPSLSSRFPT